MNIATGIILIEIFVHNDTSQTAKRRAQSKHNRVKYLATDVFVKYCWRGRKKLKGHRFLANGKQLIIIVLIIFLNCFFYKKEYFKDVN